MAPCYIILYNATIPSNLIPTIQNIGAPFKARFNKDLVITSGVRTPLRQAQIMYDQMRGLSQSDLQKYMAKYTNKKAAQAALQAYLQNQGNPDAAINAMAGVFQGTVGTGNPFTNHFGPDCFDVQNNQMMPDEKQEFLRDAVAVPNVHVIVEAPKGQLREAHNLADPIPNVTVGLNPQPHFHVQTNATINPWPDTIELPTRFVYYYRSNPAPGWRTWVQVDPTTWEEHWSNGFTQKFEVLTTTYNDLGFGVIVRRLPDRKLLVLIPDLQARPFLRVTTFPASNWSFLGKMEQAE